MITLWSILLYLSVGAQAAAADCLVNSHPYQLQSDIVEWQMKARIGQTCRHGVRFKLVSNPVIKIVSPPQFGTLTVQGPSFSYTAGTNFQNEDSFTVEVSGSIGRVSGSSSIHVVVSNIEAATTTPQIAHVLAAPHTAPVETIPSAQETIPSAHALLPPCPIWDWSKGSPPPMIKPFDKSKLYCPPSPFNPPNAPIGCICSQ
jgi:hypothetical protein